MVRSQAINEGHNLQTIPFDIHPELLCLTAVALLGKQSGSVFELV